MDKNAEYRLLYHETHKEEYTEGVYVGTKKSLSVQVQRWRHTDESVLGKPGIRHYILVTEVYQEGKTTTTMTCSQIEHDPNFEARLIRQAIARFDELKQEYFPDSLTTDDLQEILGA